MSVHAKRREGRYAINPWLGAALALLAAAGLSGCGQQTGVTNASQARARLNPNLFSVPARQVQHVKIVAAQTVKWERILPLTGTVTYNQFDTTPVITQVSGPVARVLAVPGEHVQAGQPLLYVSSPDYTQARTAWLQARDADWLAHQNYTRAQDLYEHGAMAKRDLQAAESARNQADDSLDAARQTLVILGVKHPGQTTGGDSGTLIPVPAPVSGEVVQRTVAPGQVVQGGATQCFTIVNLSTVWVEANVFQNQLGTVRVGDVVTIHSDAYPEDFHGRISYIGSDLDPTTRTLQARIVTSNPGGRLKNNMYVSAAVNAGTIKQAVVVPDAAVLRDSNNEPFVFVEAGKNRFARRMVDIGDSQNGMTRIVSGLAAGTPVAADGSLFLQFATSQQD